VISLAAVIAARLSVTETNYFEADSAALEAYGRAYRSGARHALALNIAVSVWFCRCPHIDSRWARSRVSRLLDEAAPNSFEVRAPKMRN
jgi:hypothetical protein